MLNINRRPWPSALKETCVIPPVTLEKTNRNFSKLLANVTTSAKPTNTQTLVHIGSQVVPLHCGEMSRFCDLWLFSCNFISVHFADRSQLLTALHVLWLNPRVLFPTYPMSGFGTFVLPLFCFTFRGLRLKNTKFSTRIWYIYEMIYIWYGPIW